MSPLVDVRTTGVVAVVVTIPEIRRDPSVLVVAAGLASGGVVTFGVAGTTGAAGTKGGAPREVGQPGGRSPPAVPLEAPAGPATAVASGGGGGAPPRRREGQGFRRGLHQ